MLTRLAFNLPRNALPSVRRAVSFQVPASPRATCRALTVSAARAQSILHGSREAKEAGEHEMQQHSRLIGRGKYLHGIESTSFVHQSRPAQCSHPRFPTVHRVKPDSVKEYKKAAYVYKVLMVVNVGSVDCR